MDVEAVYAAGVKAAAHVRGGKGPYILEMLTYRYRGHSMSDPAKYRKREEVDKIRAETDPIKLLEARLLDRGLIDEADLKIRQAQIKEDIERAVDFGLDSPLPPPHELSEDVLAPQEAN